MGINFGIIKSCKNISIKGKDVLQIDFEDNSSLTIQLLKYRFVDRDLFPEIFSPGTLFNNLLIVKPEDVVDTDKNLGELPLR